jgi:hypothetical protein
MQRSAPEAVQAADAARGARRALDAVVTHHRDGFRSGVARFNELLANRLGVPVVGVDALAGGGPECPLLSFKARELDDAAAAAVRARLREPWRFELFLHEHAGLELELELLARAQRVHCGNAEIEAAVAGLAADVETLWTPGLILDTRAFRPAEVSVFSFGMAHKIRTDEFRRLRELLDASAKSYALYVSAANHETATLRDAQLVFDEMHEIFPDELYFLGNLSDVAVSNWLRTTTYFAAFFERGVRANNTSVASAMEAGAVVITNLDEHSPPELVHGDNVLDLARLDALPDDPLVIRRLAVRATETARGRSWERLVERLA